MRRTILLLTAAALIGAAIGVVQDGSSLAFWLMFAAGFLGSWGLCSFSEPLLPRHRRLRQQQEQRPQGASDKAS